jgi:glycosyltransferase involved in cell wall biosynthesis
MAVSGPGVLLLIGHLDGGGAEKQCFLLAKGLREAGFPVTVAARDAGEGILKEYGAAGVDVHLIGAPGSPATRSGLPGLLGTASRLFKSLRAARPTVVQAFLPAGNCAAALLRHAADVPIVIASHRYAGAGTLNHLFRQAAEVVACRAVDINLANSGGVAQHLARHLFLPSKSIRTVYNGAEPIDTRRCLARRDAVRSELGLTTSNIALVTIANLWPYKGYQDLVRALSGVRERQPNLRAFFIGGDRGFRRTLEELIARTGATDLIAFLGERRDVCDLLPAFDLYVSASRGEGMSNAIMEAMQHGLPVIGSRVAGTPELLEEGASGWLFRSGDIAALGDAILTLAENPGLRRELGMRGQRRIRRFSDREMVRSTLSVYAEAARQKGLAVEAEAFDRGAKYFTAAAEDGVCRGPLSFPFRDGAQNDPSPADTTLESGKPLPRKGQTDS